MVKKKDKNKIIVIGVILAIFFLMQGRGAKTNFTRTFDTTNVKPNENILVTYTAQGIASDDPWIGEFLLPSSFTWTRFSVLDNVEQSASGNIRFFSMGSSTVRFFISPTTRGVYDVGGWIYDSGADATYTWSTYAVSGDYPLDLITVTCITRDELLLSLSDWLNEQITTTQMISQIKTWLVNPC